MSKIAISSRRSHIQCIELINRKYRIRVPAATHAAYAEFQTTCGFSMAHEKRGVKGRMLSYIID
jgi:hypothetical protein